MHSIQTMVDGVTQVVYRGDTTLRPDIVLRGLAFDEACAMCSYLNGGAPLKAEFLAEVKIKNEKALKNA